MHHTVTTPHSPAPYQDVCKSISARAIEKVEGCPEVRVVNLTLDHVTGVPPESTLLGGVAGQGQGYQAQQVTCRGGGAVGVAYNSGRSIQ